MANDRCGSHVTSIPSQLNIHPSERHSPFSIGVVAFPGSLGYKPECWNRQRRQVRTFFLPRDSGLLLFLHFYNTKALNTHTHTYIHTYTHIHIHTYTCTYTCTHIHTHVHTCTHTYAHIYTYTITMTKILFPFNFYCFVFF